MKARSVVRRQRRRRRSLPGARTQAAPETSLPSWSLHNLRASMRTPARVSACRQGCLVASPVADALNENGWDSLEFKPLGAARKLWTSRSGAPTTRLLAIRRVSPRSRALKNRDAAARTGRDTQTHSVRCDAVDAAQVQREVGITLIFPQRITRRRARPRPAAPCPPTTRGRRRRPSRCATFLRLNRPSPPPPRSRRRR